MLQRFLTAPQAYKQLMLAGVLTLPSALAVGETYQLSSPDGSILVDVIAEEQLSYRVSVDGQTILAPSHIAMTFADGTALGNAPQVVEVKHSAISEQLTPVVKVRTAKIDNQYNQLSLSFKDNYRVEFRAFDEGVAYRFSAQQSGKSALTSEQAEFNFAKGAFAYFPFEKKFASATQPRFTPIAAKGIDKDELGSLPALFVVNGVNVLLTETDLQSYPGLWLRGKGDGNVYGVHPFELDKDEQYTKDYGVVSKSRSYPWRILAIARSDAELLDNQISYTLAEPSRIEDTSWIKPGKIAWDWYNENNLKGVDFKAGINTETYQYYADFAADFGIENILIDDGWSSQEDVLTVLPGIDMQAIIAHAKEKGVGVQLWVPYSALDKNLEEAFKLYAKWGINGVKIDFMDSDSIKRVDFYWRAAAMAAKYKLMVNFHGSYKPAGIHRTYPNVMTREGVRGLENNKWSEVTSTHNLHLPFIRMIAGPLDYTPGAMANAQQKNFNKVWSRPMSLTTRAQQIAMYVIYESPLQMLADTPTSYRAEPEIPRFIAAIPTVWDDFKVLHASIGEYFTIARRAGDNWYIGAMTNTQARSQRINLDFLGDGEYEMQLLQDGINAGNFAEDYKLIKKTVTKGDSLDLNMAANGGYAIQLIKR
ncbi:glycoside hydrolase family 97 protein [Shewanella halotolerans]|uniref:glycoside hydrolase family 97 protein n=1 Tax=Shewanella halotolerans TaxID=2864204 RepID=UPI001C65F5E6|nr:glycoside hydrolase family 97 protein [Shewanella halotolerans]QYJ91537.1 glycoside hydrolase family 97 protein [Shewanella halotolerans]